MILLKIDETDPTVKQWLSVDIKANNINMTALTNPVNHLEARTPNDTDTHAARSHVRWPYSLALSYK
jgi:hypothetical protein